MMDSRYWLQTNDFFSLKKICMAKMQFLTFKVLCIIHVGVSKMLFFTILFEEKSWHNTKSSLTITCIDNLIFSGLSFIYVYIITIDISDDSQQVHVWHANEHGAKALQHTFNEDSSQNWTAWHGRYQSAKGTLYLDNAYWY